VRWPGVVQVRAPGVRLVTVQPGDLDGLAGVGEGAQPVVDPAVAHASGCYEVPPTFQPGGFSLTKVPQPRTV
jgi:hypothetical protein